MQVGEVLFDLYSAIPAFEEHLTIRVAPISKDAQTNRIFSLNNSPHLRTHSAFCLL